MQGIRLNLVSECPQKPTFRRLSSEEEGTAMHFAWSRGGGGRGGVESYKEPEAPDGCPQFWELYAFSQAHDTSSEGYEGT